MRIIYLPEKVIIIHRVRILSSVQCKGLCNVGDWTGLMVCVRLQPYSYLTIQYVSEYLPQDTICVEIHF